MSHSVRVMLVGLETTTSALAVWLASTKPIPGLKRARFVKLENFQLP